MEESKQKMLIPLSYLNAYAYCPRRFYYEFVLGEMVVNEHVLEGQHLHNRVDQPGTSTRDDKLQVRHLYVCAPIVGLIGYCDLVELDGNRSLSWGDAAKQQKLRPVEYKKGRLGNWLSDHTQLCAQALALEEVLQIPSGSIDRGYLFYVGSARRDEIALDATLRQQTLELLQQARIVSQQQQPPEPITNWRKCKDCSLEGICLPREVMMIAMAGGNDASSILN